MFAYSGQISNLQVKTNDENIPGHPDDEPGRILRTQRETHRGEKSQTQKRRSDKLWFGWIKRKTWSRLACGESEMEGEGKKRRQREALLLMLLKCRQRKTRAENATNLLNQIWQDERMDGEFLCVKKEIYRKEGRKERIYTASIVWVISLSVVCKSKVGESFLDWGPLG